VAIHVSALGLIKDERGQVVRKVSKDLYCRAANTTYTLTVQNAGGTNTCSATVTVNPITQLSFSRTSQTPKQSLSCHCWLKLTSNVSPETARLHLKTYFVR
jgi:PKD repeat protein